MRGMEWINLAQDRNGWQAVRSNEPWGSIKCGEFLDYLWTG